MEAVLRSKADAPDGITWRIWRLTRIGCVDDVNTALLTASSLAAARQRVEDAGCDILPPWANGAKLFVPLTKEQILEEGLTLRAHHVIASVADETHLRQALQELSKRRRPALHPDHRAWLSGQTASKPNTEHNGAETPIFTDFVEQAETTGEATNDEPIVLESNKTFISVALPRDISENSNFANSAPPRSTSVIQEPHERNPRRFGPKLAQ